MPADGKYARVYFTIEEDERFRDVFHDARHLGTWLQLLLVAEAMYPTAAPIPAYISKPSLKILVDAGIVDANLDSLADAMACQAIRGR